MAGAFDESSFRDVRPLEVKEDAYSGLLARVRGSPDLRATWASRSSRDAGEDKSRSEGALVVHGPSGLDMTAVIDVSRSKGGRRSEEKGEALADSPLPGTYIEVTLAVEKNGKALLTLSSTMKEGRAERESVESTPHSPAKLVHLGGPDHIS
eukprot:2609273-Pleurochrysis_carterae.AAC.1